MDRFGPHPARDLTIASMKAIEAEDREGWLALFTDTALVQDPVGPSPLDPDGAGRQGPDAIAAFYDTVIANGKVSFEIRESYAGGDECANVGTITTLMPDGSKAIVEGVYVYRTNGAGKLQSIRAYWEFDNLRIEAAG